MFKTNVYTTVNAHRCREHQNTSDYDDMMVQNDVNGPQDSDIEHDPVELSDENETTSVAEGSSERLAEQLQFNLAAFFLKMQTVLHVSQRATQEIIEHIDQLYLLSEPVESVIKIMEKHNFPFTDSLVSEIVHAVAESNVLHLSVTAERPLSTAKRRKTFHGEKFPLIRPVEYLIESSKHTFMYVPILSTLYQLLKKKNRCT